MEQREEFESVRVSRQLPVGKRLEVVHPDHQLGGTFNVRCDDVRQEEVVAVFVFFLSFSLANHTVCFVNQFRFFVNLRAPYVVFMCSCH